MNASRVATHVRRDAPVPSRRGLLRGLVAAAAGLGLRMSPEAAAGRKRCKKERRKPIAPPTCAASCPAACGYCYQRPSGPVLCGNEPGIDCTRPCTSDNDCLETGTPYCTYGFTDRASGETAVWSCPGNSDGFCTEIAVCEA